MKEATATFDEEMTVADLLKMKRVLAERGYIMEFVVREDPIKIDYVGMIGDLNRMSFEAYDRWCLTVDFDLREKMWKFRKECIELMQWCIWRSREVAG